MGRLCALLSAPFDFLYRTISASDAAQAQRADPETPTDVQTVRQPLRVAEAGDAPALQFELLGFLLIKVRGVFLI
jgi:hypothetical protein